MNPISNHQIGQMTHREYETRYGASANSHSEEQEGRGQVSLQTVVFRLSSAAAVAIVLIQWLA